MIRISFVVLTYRRERQLRACLEGLKRAGVAGRAEALIGFNGRDDDTERLVALIERGYPWARADVFDAMPRGRARNRLIPRARGEIVYFLDDDAVVAEDFIDRLLDALDRHPEAAAIGGTNVCPPDASRFQRAVDRVLCSPLGAGPMRVRYVAAGPERVLPSWCFMLTSLGVRREAFERHGMAFPDASASAEENLLLHRVERRVGPLLFCPGLIAYHERRPTPASFLSQVFVNGRGRGQITRVDPSTMQLAVLAPAALAALTAAGAVRSPLGWVPAAAYLGGCAFEGLRGGWRCALLVPAAHAAYSAGLMVGLLGGRVVDAPASLRLLRDVRPAGV